MYVRHLAHPRVARLVDPSGDDLRTPCFLDPDWWARTTDLPDLLHVHFGFEFVDPAVLEHLADVLAARGVPLVHTVHDLRNPNHEDPRLHDAGLAALLRRADRLITLTDWAADQVLARCGRRPVVLAHPHVVDDADLDHRPEARAAGSRFRLVLHFKSLRANMLRAPLLDAVGDVARRRPDLAVRVHAHPDVVSTSGANHDPELVELARQLADDELIELHVHPYLAHDALVDLVRQADAFLLPYAFGTHSGLLELCRDVGTAVIAPTVGGYSDQGAAHLFTVDEPHGLDAASLERAIETAVDAGAPTPVDPVWRRRQRAHLAEAHHELYLAATTHRRRVAALSC